jgi:hypothetical protein
MLILNEAKYAKTIYDGKNQEEKFTLTKLRYVTRYLLYVEHIADDENYINTVAWMKKYHENFEESYYSKLISDAIEQAHKYPFYNIESIKITRSELDVISSLDNLRAEKILFVLLCMAKQQSVSCGFTNGLVKYSIVDLCKMARISVPADDREYILHYILQHGFLECPKKNNTKCLIVNFIDNSDDVVLNLGDIDCQELAYVYLSWKNNGKGYGYCECCGRLMKKSKTNPKRFCEDCSKIVGEVPDDKKVVLCVDCEKPVFIDNMNTRTCRCEECQRKKQLEYQRASMKKLREKE